METVFFGKLLLIPFYKPVSLTDYVVFNRLFQVRKLLALGAIIIITAVALHLKQERFQLYKELAEMMLFWVIYVINGVAYKTSFTDVTNNGITSLVVFLYKVIV